MPRRYTIEITEMPRSESVRLRLIQRGSMGDISATVSKSRFALHALENPRQPNGAYETLVRSLWAALIHDQPELDPGSNIVHEEAADAGA